MMEKPEAREVFAIESKRIDAVDDKSQRAGGGGEFDVPAWPRAKVLTAEDEREEKGSEQARARRSQ